LTTAVTVTMSSVVTNEDLAIPPILPIVADVVYRMVTVAAVVKNQMDTNVTATPTAGAISVDAVVGSRVQFTILEASAVLIDRIGELVSFCKQYHKFDVILHSQHKFTLIYRHY